MVGSDPTLLVIEDARVDAMLIRVAARRSMPGLDVRVAGDGHEGIAYLEGLPPFQERRSHPFPDLVILDLIMPVVDGFGVLEWFETRRSPRHVPVVVLTASQALEHEARCRSLGATAFHRKPDDPEGLIDTVRRIVEEHLGSDAESRAFLGLGDYALAPAGQVHLRPR